MEPLTMLLALMGTGALTGALTNPERQRQARQKQQLEKVKGKWTGFTGQQAENVAVPSMLTDIISGGLSGFSAGATNPFLQSMTSAKPTGGPTSSASAINPGDNINPAIDALNLGGQRANEMRGSSLKPTDIGAANPYIQKEDQLALLKKLLSQQA